MITALKTQPQDFVKPQTVAPNTRALINRLRFHASVCQAAAYLDIHSACELIDPTSDEAPAARTLIRILGQALDRSPQWHRPGAQELSFDELWLAQIIEACRSADHDSYTFLTTRRIAKHKQRILRVLVCNLVRTLN